MECSPQVVHYLEYVPRTDIARHMLRDLATFDQLNDPINLPRIKTDFDPTEGDYRRRFAEYAGQTVVGSVVGAELKYSRRGREGLTYRTQEWPRRKSEIVRFYKARDLVETTIRLHDSADPGVITHAPESEAAEGSVTKQCFASTRLIARQYVKLIRTPEEFRDMLELYTNTDLKDAMCAIARDAEGRIPDFPSKQGLDLDFARAVAGEPAIILRNNIPVFNKDTFTQAMPIEGYKVLVSEMSQDPRCARIMEWVTKMPFAELRNYALHDKIEGVSEQDKERIVARSLEQINAQHKLGVLEYGQLLDPALLVQYPALAVLAHEVFYNNRNAAAYCVENKIKPMQTTQRYIYELLREIAKDEDRYGRNAEAVFKALVPDARKDTVHLSAVVGLANSILRSKEINKQYQFDSIDDLADVSDALQTVLEITRSVVPMIAEHQAYVDRMNTDLIEALLNTALLAQQLRNAG